MSEKMKDAIVQGGFAPVPFNVAKSNLTIYVAETPGGHPLGNVAVNVPWLAFCSAPYLKRKNRIIPLPVADLRHAADAWAYSDKTTTYENDLGLPESVYLFTSRTLYQSSIQSPTFLGNHDLLIWQPAIEATPEGLLKFRYIVTESTNFQGWTFPRTFEYLQYALSKNGTLVPRYRGAGKLTSIKNSNKPQNLFDSNMQQMIVDYRFSNAQKSIKSLTYQTTNNYLHPTNNSELQDRFGAWVKNKPIPATLLRSRVKILLFAFFFLAPAIAFLFALVRKYKRVDPKQ